MPSITYDSWLKELLMGLDEDSLKNGISVNWQTSTLFSLDYIPEVSGVYVIFRNFGFIQTPLYVGQSSNLHKRLFEHTNNESNLILELLMTNNQRNIVVKWAKVPKSQLNGVEEFLYNKLKPACNKISPPNNKEIPCNLPI